MTQTARSTTKRNFWGGFWGGVLGILATAKLGILALMGGCLVGVLLGFYYQELWQVLKDEWATMKLQLIGDTGPSWAERWAALHPYDKATCIKAAAIAAAVLLLASIEAVVINYLL